MEKIKLDKAVVVEGRYDKIKITSIADCVVITTDGFGIYRDKKLRRLIRQYAEASGLIVLTDSDRAGRQIRAYIKRILPKELHSRVSEVHIPQIEGKERRKTAPSKEGTLGVEGVDADILRRLLAPFAEQEQNIRKTEPLTKNDLFMLGLSGTPDASGRRKELCKKLELPDGLSPSALLDLLNTLYERDEIIDILNSD